LRWDLFGRSHFFLLKIAELKLKQLIKTKTMKFDIDPKTYEEIAEVIHSDSSPVGIDAKKTHILILSKLQELSDRMERMEKLMIKK
jgi:hypothetical protein